MKHLQHIILSIFWGVSAPLFAQTQIQDADGDTRVQTEAAPDEDRIRFFAGGAQALVIRRTAAGFTLLETAPGSANAFLGEKAGEANTSGGLNVLVGFSAGKSNTEGAFNAFLGGQAGFTNTTGACNSFFGANAGFSNTTGGFNVFVGDSAGVKNTTASLNTFVGHAAGRDNTTRSGNTFIGANAGRLNVGGDSHVFVGTNAGAATVNNSTNTFIGFEAGLSNIASFNTIIGGLASRGSTTGFCNTLMGAMVANTLSTGSENTFIGSNAANGVTTGSQNVGLGRFAGGLNCNGSTFLGYNAKPSAANLSNATALGNGATVNANNKIRLGNTAVTVIEGQVAYTVSDGRFKSAVRADAPGLDFVMGLRPVTYNFRYSDFSKFLGETAADSAVLSQKDRQREMGFVAQDVEALCREQGVPTANLVHAPESPADNYSVAYGQFVVPLVQAVQEQQAQIAAQQAEIEALKGLVNQLLAAQTAAPVALPAPALELRPNPTEGVFTATFRGLAEGATLSLFGPDGALLRRWPVRDGTRTLDTEGLPAGTYFVQIAAPGQAATVKTLVKSR